MPLTRDELPVNAILSRGVVVSDDTLVISDLHLGRTSTDDLHFPTPGYDATVDRFTRALNATNPETVVLAGDVFQRFNHPPTEAIDTLSELRRLTVERGADFIVTPGNHDTCRFNIEDVYDGRLVSQYESDENVRILHGHRTPTGPADLFVVGHLHPMLERDGERWPCTLYGPGAYYGSDVLIVPPFAETVQGTPVRKVIDGTGLRMPIVEDGNGLGSYHPIVHDQRRGETSVFPRLDELEEQY